MILSNWLRSLVLATGTLILASCNTDGLSLNQALQNGTQRDLREVQSGLWATTRTHECQVWMPGQQKSSGLQIEWDGTCARGPDGVLAVSGTGKLIWARNGRLRGVFEGAMVNGKREGEATVEYFDINGQASGSYAGTFHNGERHGRGTSETKRPRIASSRYVGEFVDGLREGKGKLELTYHVAPDGLLRRPGKRFTGDFKANRPHGFVVMELPNGDQIEGNFELSKPAGEVTYIWKNGDRFVGLTSSDKPNGPGTFTPSVGSPTPATFRDGNRVN